MTTGTLESANKEISQQDTKKEEGKMIHYSDCDCGGWEMMCENCQNQLGALENSTEKKIEALKIIIHYNRINNDLDRYLLDLAKWGLGRLPDKPNIKDYGIEYY